MGFMMAGASVLATPRGQEQPVLDLMPYPAEIRINDGVFTITKEFAVTVSSNADGASARLTRGVQRMLRRLSDRSGLFIEPGAFQRIIDRDDAAMVITVARRGALKLGENESYELRVTPDKVWLDAETDIGALRGLATWLQLVTLDQRGVVAPYVEIMDVPRFPWRGLMIDSARHFMPVGMLKRTLDGMEATKLNVLHWHLTDDQGFRVECRAFPKLHELGSDGRYYKQTEIRTILAYAAERGIRVVPEFDLPGHATSWLVAYPELASQPGPYQIERKWGIFKPTMDPTREQTYQFLQVFLEEMAGLFDDEFIHIGGDENTGEHWSANPEIQQFAEEHGFADTHALQQYFCRRVQRILQDLGKRMIGWDEILQPELPTTIVIQSWRGRESLYAAAQGGYAGILSNGYYIDLIQPTEFHYLNDPLPADAPLTEEQRQLVLGGEATMWAEYVTPENVDSRIWPRTAAIAERFWSPAEVRDVHNMYRRLARISLLLEEQGLQHIRNKKAMLRRLCGCRDIQELEVFIGAVEPVKGYRRGSLRENTSYSPLTRLVDAATPDAEPARRFRWWVDELIEEGFIDRAERANVREALTRWQANHQLLDEVLRSSPQLMEMAPLSRQLAEVATVGLEALAIIESKATASESWLKDRLDTLRVASEPCGEAEIVIVTPVRQLVFAAAKVDKDAWKESENQGNDV